MIALLDTSEQLDTAAAEIGLEVEQLLTPLTRFRRKNPNGKFAIDNGCFMRFEQAAFLALLEREKDAKELCRFVTVPDVVGSARRTLEVFDYWYERLCGWQLALVAQDGQEDLPINWDLISAVFIGGSTRWKESDAAAQVVKAARLMNKWVHIGRINQPMRYEWFEMMNADSMDGTGISQYSKQRYDINRRKNHPTLLPKDELYFPAEKAA